MKRISKEQLDKLLNSVIRDNNEITKFDDKGKRLTIYEATKKEGQLEPDIIGVTSLIKDKSLISFDLCPGRGIKDDFLYFIIDKENPNYFILEMNENNTKFINDLDNSEFIFNGLTIDFFSEIISVYEPKKVDEVASAN